MQHRENHEIGPYEFDQKPKGDFVTMIPALPQVGGTELLILLIIILLLFGAKRIPQLARSLGTGTREFCKGISGAYDKDEAGDGDESKEGKEVFASEGTPSAEQKL
jgi:sec-independent protein translocase protein TatA